MAYEYADFDGESRAIQVRREAGRLHTAPEAKRRAERAKLRRRLREIKERIDGTVRSDADDRRRLEELRRQFTPDEQLELQRRASRR